MSRPTLWPGARCWYCKRLIWPWQRVGWRVTTRTIFWHPPCRDRVQQHLVDETEAWAREHRQRQAELRWREENEL